jgi:hypothetical protein
MRDQMQEQVNDTETIDDRKKKEVRAVVCLLRKQTPHSPKEF